MRRGFQLVGGLLFTSTKETEWESSPFWQICEDKPEVLDQDVLGLSERPINVFLPRLLQVCIAFKKLSQQMYHFLCYWYCCSTLMGGSFCLLQATNKLFGADKIPL